ncbi:MAG: hypothetical protein E7538_03480 [Ruminococcaceae bacterium]|nr:hypothetical protein [Oscillospiraceae bacterium]
MNTETKEVRIVKKGKGKTVLKVSGIIFGVIVLITAVVALTNFITTNANIKKAESYEKVVYENQLVPEQDENGYWTFTTDKELKVMQLTDVHIGGGFLSSKKDSMAMNAVAAMVTAEKPDLVIVTGDVSYPVPFQAGTFNNLSSARIFGALMDSLGVYWTLGYGNHDTEAYSYYGREALSELYGENYDYCIFEKGPDEVDGYGNQIIKVTDSKGIITQALYVLDSHSYVDGDILGIMWKYDNIHENQVQWYKDTIKALNDENNETYKKLGKKMKSDIKSAAFFHIPLTEQKDAWYEYAENNFADTEDVKFYYGVAGESSKVVYCGIGEDDMFEAMLETGSTKAVFCGHDHYNNFSVEYKGIRLTYGMSVDYLAYPGIYQKGSQRGCTLISFSPDGSFDCTAQSYYQDKYTGIYEKEDVTMQEISNIPFEEIKSE